ncbi:MAG: ABC transporter ATP-binding protein [Hyphomicrobiales bacterium]
MKLSISNLCKTYPNGVKAINDLSLDINDGLFGLLGPNGAGKSSLMRTIATLQEADSGNIFLDDIDVLKEKDEIKKLLGYLPQDFGFFPGISATDLLNYFAVLKGYENKKERKETVNYLLNQVNLYDKRKSKVNQYSGGMMRRFGIAIALLGDPRLIIVDEPTAGLDPSERIRFNNLLSEISENKIVILSTHIVSDVSDLCHEMAIINNGSLKAQGNPTSLLEELEGTVWEKKVSKEELSQYKEEHNVLCSWLHEGEPILHIHSNNNPGNGFKQASIRLEDVYFNTLNQ